MKTTKVIKLTAITLVALMAMPGIATAQKNYNRTFEENIEVEAQKAKQEICKISGNDCQEVVTLLYEIFMVKDWKRGYDIKNHKLEVLEPYATQLKEMNITVVDMDRYRDGGTTYLKLADGTSIYFDNSMSKTTLDDPRVTFPDGRTFSFSRSEMEKTIEKNLRISGNDCQEVVDLLYEIFVEKEAYNHQDNVKDDYRTKNTNCKVLEPYASKLQKMNVTIKSVHIYTSRYGLLVTYISLGDDTEVYFAKDPKTGQYTETDVEVGGYYHLSLPVMKEK